MPSVSRSDWYWAIAIALLTGTLFLVTLRPDVGGTEDSPKFQFLGQVLGTAHTPGYPFYTIATYLFTRLPLGTLAYRVNLFSGVCGVFSCVCIFLIARRIGVSRSLAAVASLAAATGFPVWSNAITAEVYTLAALMSAWTIYLLIAWAQEPGNRHFRLFAACAVFAAGLGNHLTIVGLLPAALIYGIARDRLVLKPRVIAIAAIIGALGVAQYGFIALRTIQGAPYLEARATTLRGVYDVIIARDVSWARFYQAADKVVGIEVPMLLEGLRVHMGTVTVILVVVAIGIALWRRNHEALLVAGGAAGTLGMIANLWGDVVGFITPVIVLLWTLAAYGLEAVVRAIRPSSGVVNGVAALALLVPLWNLIDVYPALSPVLNPGDAPALRALYPRLPPDGAVVAHNYFIARIFNYLHFSNEYDPDPSPRLLNNDAVQVKAAAAEGRPVFALEEAVPWLAAQGLQFEPTALSTTPFERWVAGQREGTRIVIAAAGRMVPPDWLPAALRDRLLRRANFSAITWRIGDEPAVDLSDDGATSTFALANGGTVAVTSDDAGARVTLEGNVLAAIDRGLLVLAFSSNGGVTFRSELSLDDPPGMRLRPIAHRLRGELPCEVLRTGQPVDVSHIVKEGGWYASIDGRQTPAEISIADGGAPAGWRHGLSNGRGKATIDDRRSRLLLDGAPGTRAVFQFSLPANLPVRATLETEDHAVRVCQVGIPSFPATGALLPGPASDAHFGVGWHAAEEAGVQRFRWSQRSSTLRWRMASPAALRFILPLRAAHADGATISATLNGAEIESCVLPTGAWLECRLTVDAGSTRSGINELTLTSNTSAPGREGDPRELAFAIQPARVRVGQ